MHKPNQCLGTTLEERCPVYGDLSTTSVVVRAGTGMTAARRPRATDALEVRRVCGYVAVRPTSGSCSEATGWLYLRKHSRMELFLGNMPQPDWFSVETLSKAVTRDELQERMKAIVKRMVPGADTVRDIFSTGNGRLATQIIMADGEAGVQDVLKSPSDNLYVDWDQLREGTNAGEQRVRESVVDRWIRDHDEARDENAVTAWSNAVMKAYEAREKKKAEEKERREKETAIPDEDGFVTVSNGAKQMKADEAMKIGTKGRTSKGHYKSKSSKNRKALLDAGKGIEKAGFYRWQRENKSALVELRNKFKEDRKRIAAIRALGNQA